jgi:hypothetical protein
LGLGEAYGALAFGTEPRRGFAEHHKGERAMTTFNAVGTSFVAAIAVLGIIVAIF